MENIFGKYLSFIGLPFIELMPLFIEVLLSGSIQGDIFLFRTGLEGFNGILSLVDFMQFSVKIRVYLTENSFSYSELPVAAGSAGCVCSCVSTIT